MIAQNLQGFYWRWWWLSHSPFLFFISLPFFYSLGYFRSTSLPRILKNNYITEQGAKTARCIRRCYTKYKNKKWRMIANSKGGLLIYKPSSDSAPSAGRLSSSSLKASTLLLYRTTCSRASTNSDIIRRCCTTAGAGTSPPMRARLRGGSPSRPCNPPVRGGGLPTNVDVPSLALKAE